MLPSRLMAIISPVGHHLDVWEMRRNDFDYDLCFCRKWKCYQCGGCGILFRLKSFSIYCWSYLSMSFINYVWMFGNMGNCPPLPLPPPTPLKVFGQNDPNEREGGGQWPKDISDPDVLLSKTFKILRGKTILYLLWCDPPRSFPRPTKLCSHYTHCKYFVSNIGVSFLFHFVKLLWALRATANIFSHLLKGGPGFFLNLWEPDVYRLKVLICRNGKLCSHNVKEDL